MSTTRPPTCHHTPGIGYRTLPGHRDDCTNPHTHQACLPCTAPHCVLDGRRHATNDHPITCPTCLGAVTHDLTQIPALLDALAHEATDSPAAAARIPGGTATILRGPAVPIAPSALTNSHDQDHRPSDPNPPAAVLAHWEHQVRAWLGHQPATATTIEATVGYLVEQVRHLAQAADGPDWPQLVHDVQHTRAALEHALHDETTPDRGVPCFECGTQLVRRHYAPTPCRHTTPARRELQRWLRLGYPEAVSQVMVRAARRPCARCDQGGLAFGVGDPARDPARGTSGVAWECPGCRKRYDPGEYATAVRRDLLEGGPDGDGWTHVAMAAEAAADATGRPITASTVRTWIGRGDDIGSCCQWAPGVRTGLTLVYWPDVLTRAAEHRTPGRRPRAS